MAVSPRRQRRRPYGALLLLGLLILGLGWVLYLRLTDQPLRDPFGFYTPAPALPEATAGSTTRTNVLPPAEGKTRVLISAREIPAYARVTRDDLFDGTRGIFAYMDLDEEFVEDNGILVGTSPIVGRVMKRPKRAGFAFTEADFLPKGTRPGLAGGIPPGKRAMRIDVELVGGIIGLNPGDRFDVVAARTLKPLTQPVDIVRPGVDTAGLDGVYSRLAGQRPRPPVPSRDPVAKVDVIVQGGVVVSPLETRLIPTSSASLTVGQITGTRPVQEMVIALDPEEVAPLTAALRLEADLTCVARSGHPGDPADSVTPGLAPVDASAKADDDRSAAASAGSAVPAGYVGTGFTVVETIVGGERVLTAVPRATAAPAGGDR